MLAQAWSRFKELNEHQPPSQASSFQTNHLWSRPAGNDSYYVAATRELDNSDREMLAICDGPWQIELALWATKSDVEKSRRIYPVRIGSRLTFLSVIFSW